MKLTNFNGTMYQRDVGAGGYAGVISWKPLFKPVNMGKVPTKRDTFKTAGRVISENAVKIHDNYDITGYMTDSQTDKFIERQRKVQKHPSRYQPGTVVRVIFKDGKRYRIINK